MTNDIDYAGLILEDQLLDHLATPEGCMAVWRERLDPEVVPEVNDGIREALAFVIEYIDTYGQPPDVSVLAEETGYEDFENPVAPIEYVIDKLKERNVRKELKQAITKVSRLVGEPQVALNTMFAEATRIMSENISHRNVLDTDNTSLVLDRYKSRQLIRDSGISFGYEQIDGALGGLRKGELYFVVGRPGRFKTWQLVKSAVESFFNGNTVTIMTLELSPEEIQDRVLCMVAGVSWDQFMHGALPPADEAVLLEAGDWLQEHESKIHIVQPPIGERTVTQMKQFAVDAGSDALYIDQLSYIDAARKSDQQWIELGYKCHELKIASADIPIMCAAQFNREAVKAKSVKDLDLANIALSDSVGQTADIVFGLYANKDMMHGRILQYGIVKARSFSERAWELKVSLSYDTNFHLVDELNWDEL